MTPVLVGVLVGVSVGVSIGVSVGVGVGISVKVSVGISVGIIVGSTVGSGVGRTEVTSGRSEVMISVAFGSREVTSSTTEVTSDKILERISSRPVGLGEGASVMVELSLLVVVVVVGSSTGSNDVRMSERVSMMGTPGRLFVFGFDVVVSSSEEALVVSIGIGG
jgi:hypothetical protein